MEASLPNAPGNALAGLLDERAGQDRAYLLDARSTRALTYVALRDESELVVARLARVGLRAGARVGLVLSDPLTFAAWFVGGLAAGLWVAPLDPTLSTENLSQHDARGVALGLDAILSDRDGPVGASLNWLNVLEATSVDEARPSRTAVAGGVLLSSSGTTGTPKVMALPLAQLLANATLIAEHNELAASDRGFNPLPLWHVNAEVVGLLATLVAGSSLVLDDRFHRTGFWKIVDDFEVTWINGVPAIISHLVQLHEGERPPSRIRFVRSASAPLSPALFENFEAATGIPVIESYGMTEAASQICANPLRGVRKSGSVGVPVGALVRVTPLDESADDSRVGHIEIKGPTVITSYESADYADRFDAEGWLRTGDLGYFDDDDYLFIVGRSDDVINRGGEKIYPLEIENTLAQVVGVGAVVVIGEADPVFNQVPVAYVRPSDLAVLRSADALNELVGQLRHQAEESFGRSSRPVSLKFVEQFPAHATGKIRRGLLRDGDVVVVHEARLT